MTFVFVGFVVGVALQAARVGSVWVRQWLERRQVVRQALAEFDSQWEAM